MHSARLKSLGAGPGMTDDWGWAAAARVIPERGRRPRPL